MHAAFQTVCLIAILFFASLLSSLAQSINEVFEIPKLNGKISVDGKVDEAVWATIDPLPLIMHWPDYEGQITEPTEFRIAYYNQFIYVGAICYDSDPSGMQGPTFQRDGLSQQSDHVALILDPYNDNENAVFFAVAPTGSRSDFAIKNDAQGIGTISDSWNSYWIANTSTDENGWQVEMRIPFSSLRFQVQDGKVELGLIVYRYTARKRELSSYPAIRPDWCFWSFVKPSQAQTVSFEGIQNKRPWYTSPYLLLGTGYHHQTNGQGIYEKIDDPNFQVGLDIQHAFSDNLNADFTINTDFAQVEADNQVVNLSRFSLFFPEKRRFFLERASTFDFQYDLNNNLFYSRRIGIEDGDLIPLYGGVRLVGRLNKWDVGFLNMQSREKDDFPSENFGVLRLRRNILNQRSYVGGMFTSRIGTDGHRNFAYGIDGIINLFKQDYLQVNVAQTQDTNDTTGISAIDRSRIYLMWENRIINGFGYRFSYSNVGANYNPGVGFEQRFNFSQFGDQLFYSWFAPEESSLRQTTITLNGSVSLNNSSNQLETYLVGLSSSWIWNRNAQLTIGLEDFFDDVPNEFSLSDDIKITPGAYSNISGSVEYSTPAVNFIKLEMIGKIGSFYDGDLSSISLAPEIVFSKYFQLATFYQFTHIDFKDMNKKFQSHLARLNMATSINVKLSASAFVQFNTLDEISAINFRLRYAPVDGNDLYFVYNEILNTNPMSEIPHLPPSDNRAILLKYIHTFKL
ncbi:MAG: carbohydrate binding family 9 domain-containing protein [Cyclobacteriaceae bacterium]|nr:carbohydrate binding family 9 domain-containing protein [Cyclobacteriaceae bacterium]